MCYRKQLSPPLVSFQQAGLSPFTPSLGERWGEDHKAFFLTSETGELNPWPGQGRKGSGCRCPQPLHYWVFTLDNVEGLWLTTNSWYDTHWRNTDILRVVSFAFLLTLSSGRKSICSSIRKRHNAVPNVHLHLMSSAHRTAERPHEACQHSAKKPGTQYTAKTILLFP